jgi:uncharacterized phage protein gp47/JayE
VSPTCGCCANDVAPTPATVSNRPGLTAVAYRIGTYARFRESMLEAIAGTPELASLATRQSDDYSVTFIELWAAVLDVLTFYQERYANEVFLRTAQRSTSLRRLARLLDYSPRPGVAALAKLAFTLDPGKTAQIPIGLRVQSVPAQNQQPQTYETLEAVSADSRFNRLRIFPAPTPDLPLHQGSHREILDRIQGPTFLAALSANDPVVLFNDQGSDNPEMKKIASLTAQDDVVALRWSESIQGQNWNGNSKAYKYRRTFRLFGYNAPQFFMQASSSTLVAGGILWTQQQTDFTYPAGNTLSLDSRYDLTTGTQLLIVFPPQAGTVQTNLVTVTQVTQASATTPVQGQSGQQAPQGAMSDTVTQVTIDPALPAVQGSSGPGPAIQDIEKVIILELVGDQIPFWGQTYQGPVNTSAVYLPGRFTADGASIEVGLTIQKNHFIPGLVITPSDIDVGRNVILGDAQGEPVEATVQGPAFFDVTPVALGFGHLVIPLQVSSYSLDNATAVLLGNVVRASHGQTVSNEVLGSGDASQTFQSFSLQKQPLTFVPSSAPGGVASSLQLSVNQVKWTEVRDLYGQSPTAQVFSTRLNDNGQTLVQGGDSTFGVVFPTGKANVTATYRFGSGLAGDVGANSLTTLLDRIQGLTSVTNPLPAEGGADPETPDKVRQNAPRTVRTFDRAVSLIDFQDLIKASGEVAKALATWLWDGFAPAVHLTVAGQQGRTFSDLRSLAATLENARDPNHRLLIGNYTKVPVLLSAKVWVNPAYSQADVLAAATQAVLTALSFDQLELGQALHLSQMYAVLQGVTGVVGADVTRFGFKDPTGRGVTLLAGGVVAPVQDFLRIFSARPDPDPHHPGQILPAEMATIESPTQDVSIVAESS